MGLDTVTLTYDLFSGPTRMSRYKNGTVPCSFTWIEIVQHGSRDEVALKVEVIRRRHLC